MRKSEESEEVRRECGGQERMRKAAENEEVRRE